MRINKKILGLVDIVSKEPYRQALTGIRFENGKAIATDGYKLLILELDKTDINDLPKIGGQEAIELDNVTVPSKDIKIIAKSIKKSKNIALLNLAWNVKAEDGKVRFITTDLDTNEIFDSKLIEVDYPKYEKILPTKKPKFKIGVSVEHLEAMATAMRKSGADIITLEFNKPLDPIVLKAKDYDKNIYGLIMPVRLIDEEKKYYEIHKS